jgi:uncharacterized protein (TIGR03083 family)
VTTQTFTPWVAPIAAALRENRAQVVAFARAQPLKAWERPSPLPGWTCKDLLAHIGKANDQVFQQLLRSVIAGERIDTRAIASVDTDGNNRRGVEERRSWPAADVIAEVEESGAEVQDLLAQLTEEHEHLRQDDPPFIFKTFLPWVLEEAHDLEHLAQLRAAMETPR